jgi:hypothetical protein
VKRASTGGRLGLTLMSVSSVSAAAEPHLLHPVRSISLSGCCNKELLRASRHAPWHDFWCLQARCAYHYNTLLECFCSILEGCFEIIECAQKQVAWVHLSHSLCAAALLCGEAQSVLSMLTRNPTNAALMPSKSAGSSQRAATVHQL